MSSNDERMKLGSWQMDMAVRSANLQQSWIKLQMQWNDHMMQMALKNVELAKSQLEYRRAWDNYVEHKTAIREFKAERRFNAKSLARITRYAREAGRLRYAQGLNHAQVRGSWNSFQKMMMGAGHLTFPSSIFSMKFKGTDGSCFVYNKDSLRKCKPLGECDILTLTLFCKENAYTINSNAPEYLDLLGKCFIEMNQDYSVQADLYYKEMVALTKELNELRGRL